MRGRGASPRAERASERSEDASDASVIRQKSEKILSRPPLPIRWERFFFFDGSDPTSTLRAYEAARRFSAGVAAFKVPTCPGPWASVKLIGDLDIETIK